MSGQVYGITRGHRKKIHTFKKIKVGDILWVDRERDDFFKVTKVSSMNFILFRVNYIECDFYWNCAWIMLKKSKKFFFLLF